MKLFTLLCSLFLFANSALAFDLNCPTTEEMLSAEFFKAVKGNDMWEVYSKPFTADGVEWNLHVSFRLDQAGTPAEAMRTAHRYIANQKIDFEYERPEENDHHINVCSDIRDFGWLHLYALTPPQTL